MLKVKNLTKIFHQGDKEIIPVNDISFNVPKGDFAVILGKSGSGKSTLLSLIGALDKPDEGSIEIDGEDITKMGDNKLISYRRDKIGFVFQNYSLIPNLTAQENVMIPMEFIGISLKARKDSSSRLLDRVGITGDTQNRKPGRLSGGEQQRVAIARAVANKPKLILADEPTGNLDSKTSKIIIDLLKELSKTEKMTIIVVTHDEQITRLADKTFRITDGKIS